MERIREVHLMRYLFTPEVDLMLDAAGLRRLTAEQWLDGQCLARIAGTSATSQRDEAGRDFIWGFRTGGWRGLSVRAVGNVGAYCPAGIGFE